MINLGYTDYHTDTVNGSMTLSELPAAKPQPSGKTYFVESDASSYGVRASL